MFLFVKSSSLAADRGTNSAGLYYNNCTRWDSLATCTKIQPKIERMTAFPLSKNALLKHSYKLHILQPSIAKETEEQRL